MVDGCPDCNGSGQVKAPWARKDDLFSFVPCRCNPKWTPAPEPVSEERDRLRTDNATLRARVAEVEGELAALKAGPTDAAVRDAVEKIRAIPDGDKGCQAAHLFERHFRMDDEDRDDAFPCRTLLSYVRAVQSPRLTDAVAWSKEAPTSPGWWWMRGEGADSRAQVVEVYFRDPGPAPTEDEWQHVVRFWPKPHMRVRGQGFDGGMDCYQECEWAGPLTDPEEGTAWFHATADAALAECEEEGK